MRKRWVRTLSITVLLAVPLLGRAIGRLYRGAHHLTDVLAAYINGGICLTIAAGVILARGPLARFCQLDGDAHGPSAGPRDGGDEVSRAAVVYNPIKVTDLPALTTRVEKFMSEQRLGAAALAGDHARRTPASACAARRVDEGCDVVFVCGGDGTVMAAATALAGQPVPLAILPAGTGNLLARNLDLPINDEAQCLRIGVSGRDPRDRRGGGRGPQVRGDGGPRASTPRSCGTPRRGLKKKVGWPAYVVSAAKHLRGRGIRVTITIDDGTPLHRRVRTVVVGNVGKLQGNIPLLPDAQPDDGVLDVVVIAIRNVLDWARVAGRVVRRARRAGPPDGALHRPARADRVQPHPAAPAGRRRDREQPHHGHPDRAGCAAGARRRAGGLMSSVTRVPQTRTMVFSDTTVGRRPHEVLRHYGRLHLVKSAFVRFRYGDGFSHSRALALQLVLSLIPLGIAFVGLSSTINAERPARVLREVLLRITPGSTDEIVRKTLDQGQHEAGSGGQLALWLGLVVSLVALTTSMGQIERGANRIYGIQRDRPALKKYGRAVLMALTAGLMSVVGLLIIVGGGTVGEVLADVYNWQDFGLHVWQALRFPVGHPAGVRSVRDHRREVAAAAAAGLVVGGHRRRGLAGAVDPVQLRPVAVRRAQRLVRLDVRPAHRRDGAAAVGLPHLDRAVPRHRVLCPARGGAGRGAGADRRRPRGRPPGPRDPRRLAAAASGRRRPRMAGGSAPCEAQVPRKVPTRLAKCAAVVSCGPAGRARRQTLPLRIRPSHAAASR